MKPDNFRALDRGVARARIVLSLLAMLSLYIDPSAGGLFHLTRFALITLLCHLGYSVCTYFVVTYEPAPQWLSLITVALDLIFATAIAYLTQGQAGPAYVFFVFAIIAVGVRTGLRATLWVTLLSGVTLYLLAILFSNGLASSYLMRAAYLGIAGYLVGFFGQQRINYEARMRELEAKAQREVIARSLHDSYVQSLAGVNLRLETCRELLRRGRPDDVSKQLQELQVGVAREYDGARNYIRSLAGLDSASAREVSSGPADPTIEVHAAFKARSRLAERIFLIVLEGLRNARQHASASLVTIGVRVAGENLVVTISDDGIGYPRAAGPPWTIASHVSELGGRIHIDESHPAQLNIELPWL